MRLITRADWDGLVCAVLLSTVEHIEAIQFAYPKDVQDGKVNVPPNSVIANLPYHPSCEMWFDHHSSEEMLGAPMAAFTGIKGRFGLAPSAARLIYEYYGGDLKFERFKELVEATDRVDSAQLTMDDVLNPQGYVLLACAPTTRPFATRCSSTPTWTATSSSPTSGACPISRRAIASSSTPSSPSPTSRRGCGTARTGRSARSRSGTASSTAPARRTWGNS